MRRHMSMEQLARDVLTSAATSVREKTASAANLPKLRTEIGQLLTKVASDLRELPGDVLTYDDIAVVAEARRAKYRAS